MQQPQRCTYSIVLMGSPVQLTLLSADETLAANVFRLIRQYEDLLTVNRADSQVMAINHAAGNCPVAVSGPVFVLIKCAKDASMPENSAFNLAIGPLVKRWRIGFKGQNVPPAEEINRLLRITRPHDVELDEQAGTVFLRQPGMELDLGAIAKGYIADRVRDYLHKQGVQHGLINLGGNVQTLGALQQGWQIGLKKPFAGADVLLGTLRVENKSVVTSGIYERCFELNGRCYHHILDPRTGYPLDNSLLSVTVISDDSLQGDIWTTLLYGMGISQSCALLRTRSDIEAIFVTRDHDIVIPSSRQFTFTQLDPGFRLAYGGV